jgi:peptidoglycan/LPS O-acetylase OafA/YrhL
MAIGGIGAWLVYTNNRWLKLLYGKASQLFSFTLLIACIAFDFKVPFFTDELYAMLFCALIINLAVNSRSLLNLENAPLRFLGTISYGLYMYHPLAVVLAIRFVLFFFPSTYNTFPAQLLTYAASILLTIGIASVSYHYFENYFLRLKRKVTVIISGDDATSNPG